MKIGICIVWLICFGMIVFNGIRNRRWLLAVSSSIIIILITYGENINQLHPSAEWPAGIGMLSFTGLGFIIFICALVAKIKFKMKKRNNTFALLSFVFILLLALSRPNYGGALMEDEEYFKWNLRTYLSLLPFLLLQANLLIHFISQPMENKEKNN